MFYRPCNRNSASGWLQIDHKLEKRQWRYNLLTRRYCQSFVHVIVLILSSLVTGLSFMSISWLVLELDNFVYKGMIRNLEIPPSEFRPTSGELGWVRNIKFSTNVFNEKLLNAENARVTPFITSELLRGNYGEGIK